MKTLALSIYIVLWAGLASAADNPCYHSGRVKSVPHGKESVITLRAVSVRSFTPDSLIYDLGRETITIKADSLRARQFIRDLTEKRCGARTTVLLSPASGSQGNTEFKAKHPSGRGNPAPTAKSRAARGARK